MTPDMPEPVDRDLLGQSLAELAHLETGVLDLETSLISVARLAVNAIPGADGAGLTLLENERTDAIVATADFVSEIDSIQYGIGEGPCISAAATRETIMSGSLGADPRWTRFGAQVARLGVHSVLSLPLLIPGGLVGAMNVYAYDKHTFDDRAARVGELFSSPAAIAVRNAQVLSQTRRLAGQLQEAMASRSVIDQAIGIVMSRSGVSEAEALERLRTLSQHEHQKLITVATRMVDESVRRARARGVQSRD